MELVLAASSAAVVSACTAALRDHPELAARLKRSLRRAVAPFAKPSATDALHDALRGLPVALDAARSSLDGSRRGLKTTDLLRIAACIEAAPPGTLRRLNLSHTPLSVDVAASLSQAHAAISQLHVLRLRGCALGDSGVALICMALNHRDATASTTITELALAANGLTPHAADALASAVRESPSLCTLDLSYNQLGPAGCIAIAEAIGERRVLQTLSLSSAGLDDDSVVRLGHALSSVSPR